MNKKVPGTDFGKNSETDEYVFFVVDPRHENYKLVQNVVDWQSYVAEYALSIYPIYNPRVKMKVTTQGEEVIKLLRDVIGFIAHYFFNPVEFPEIYKLDDPVNNDFLFCLGSTKGLGKIKFHDFNKACSSVDRPNILVFKEQIEVFKEFLMTATPSKEQAENIEDNLLDPIFDIWVRDFSKYALQLYSKPSSTEKQMALCMQMIKKPLAQKKQTIWLN